MPEPTPREAELSAELAQVSAKNAALEQELKLLREKLDLLMRKLFGRSSEKISREQLQLLLQGFDVGKAPEPVAAEEPRRSTAPSPPRNRDRRPRLPEHLPIVEEVLEPEPVQACPEAWRRIGEEVTEQLDYEPARYFRRRIVRPKYVRHDHPFAAPVIAPLDTLQERCLAAPALIASILVSKFCDHLPLYRQEQILATRFQIPLPRQTMAHWMGLAADWLRPIYDLLRGETFATGYVQVDETPVRYLAPGHGQTKLGYLWTCARPGGDTIFHWHPSRAAQCLEQVIPADFRGTLQTDGYAAYPAFARQHNERAGTAAITLAGCWAHARRALSDARESSPRVCDWLLHQIRLLYRLEDQLRTTRAGPALRQALRASHSRPILRRLHAALLRLRPRFLPQSQPGKACTYLLDQWPALQRFLDDGRLEIDNNLVENAIRPTALGKKNWLFFGAEDMGQRGAILYTLIESCRRLRLDPFAYLRDVLTRLPTATTRDLPNLTPAAWAKAQRPLAAAA
jgi:transposase